MPFDEGKCTIEKMPNFKRLLEILEVDFDKLQPITQPTKFDKIILPDESFSVHSPPNGFTAEYKETIDRVRDFAIKNWTPTSNKKVYYFHGLRSQVCEERLADYLKSKGYAVVSPEKLTLDEQLNLLINCEHFASTIGSCSHNAMFLRDGTEAIFIPRIPNRFTVYQQAIDELRSLKAIYIDATLSFFSNSFYGPFFYIISEQLKRFFREKWNGYDEEDFKTFLQYVKDSLRQGRVVNPNAMKYYAPVFEDFMEQLNRREDLIAAYDMPPRWETFQPSITYKTHVAKKAWSAWLNENQISNDIEQQLDIQAVKINFPGHKVYYSVYFNDAEGWSEEVTNGEQAGTTGKAKPIYGIKIRFDEAGAKEFDILYRVHKFDGNWTSWAKNGEVIYSHGQKLNAIQIKLEKHS